MTSDVSRLLTLVRSIPNLEGKRPFKFESRDSIIELASIADVLVKQGGVSDSSNALGIARAVATVTEGCLHLPLSNVFWWRHFEDQNPVEKILVVFVERPQEGGDASDGHP